MVAKTLNDSPVKAILYLPGSNTNTMLTKLPNSVGFIQYSQLPTGELSGEWFVNTAEGQTTGYEIAKGDHPSVIHGSYDVKVYKGTAPNGTLSFSGKMVVALVDDVNFLYKIKWTGKRPSGEDVVFTGVGFGSQNTGFVAVWNNDPDSQD